jgi:hypothetical protein
MPQFSAAKRRKVHGEVARRVSFTVGAIVPPSSHRKESGESFVRSIAEDSVCAVFAGAEVYDAIFFGGVGNG